MGINTATGFLPLCNAIPVTDMGLSFLGGTIAIGLSGRYRDDNTMNKDRLVLLEARFEDPAFPGQQFYCWHCMLLEGLVARFPTLHDTLDVVRIPWPRPRHALITLLGEQHQSLPVLIFAAGAPDDLVCGAANGLQFADDKDIILRALAVRHGLPVPHP